jgi:hypothetical protein
LLKKIVYAGSNNSSFGRGSEDLRVLAEVSVPVKQVERLTRQIGVERQGERDALVAAWLARPLAQREDPPPGQTPAALAVAEMDGGRVQIRDEDEDEDAADAGTGPPGDDAGAVPTSGPPVPAAAPPAAAAAAEPAEPAGGTDPPSTSRHWREDKVGCLLEMTSVVRDSDPCPDIPATFVDPLRSLKLAQAIGHCALPAGAPFQATQPPAEGPDDEEAPAPRPGRPEVVQRRVVASRRDVTAFGPLLAATACTLGLFAASRRAFVADGQAENWTVHKRYFARWTPVLDFVHALSYVYAAAMAGRTFAVGWPVYQRWIGWVWGGQVSQVIAELAARQQEVGVATKEDKEGSPRRVVQETLTYLSNHQGKMRYDEYRKQGLPLMSSHVESTVKQINYRVKGTEKFWSEAGAEAVLQLRADYLSDDEPLEDFWQRRQEAATGQRRYRRSA